MAIAFTAPVIPVFVAVVIALSSSHSHIIVIFMVTLLSTGSGGSGSDVEVDLVHMWQAHTRQQREAWVHAEQEWQGVRRWLVWQGGLWMQKWRCMVGHRDGLHVLPRRVWADHNREVAMGRKCGEKAGRHSGKSCLDIADGCSRGVWCGGGSWTRIRLTTRTAIVTLVAFTVVGRAMMMVYFNDHPTIAMTATMMGTTLALSPLPSSPSPSYPIAATCRIHPHLLELTGHPTAPANIPHSQYLLFLLCADGAPTWLHEDSDNLPCSPTATALVACHRIDPVPSRTHRPHDAPLPPGQRGDSDDQDSDGDNMTTTTVRVTNTAATTATAVTKVSGGHGGGGGGGGDNDGSGDNEDFSDGDRRLADSYCDNGGDENSDAGGDKS
ncbi:hypothetical protein EDB83DRAFT_2318166 [Lactarius deliciosus]|nr:hypothetical protein EDB83DRAFT_2318166 [Lactarius deliciosus]